MNTIAMLAESELFAVYGAERFCFCQKCPGSECIGSFIGMVSSKQACRSECLKHEFKWPRLFYCDKICLGKCFSSCTLSIVGFGDAMGGGTGLSKKCKNDCYTSCKCVDE